MYVIECQVDWTRAVRRTEALCSVGFTEFFRARSFKQSGSWHTARMCPGWCNACTWTVTCTNDSCFMQLSFAALVEEDNHLVRHRQAAFAQKCVHKLMQLRLPVWQLSADCDHPYTLCDLEAVSLEAFCLKTLSMLWKTSCCCSAVQASARGSWRLNPSSVAVSSRRSHAKQAMKRCSRWMSSGDCISSKPKSCSKWEHWSCEEHATFKKH